MINMWDAFSGDTTTLVRYFKKRDGYYDEDNYWITEGFDEAIPLSVTPIPFGDMEAGIAGIELKPKTTGERTPAFMMFTGKTELSINDRIEVYGETYKMLKKLKNSIYGFHTMIGSFILEDAG